MLQEKDVPKPWIKIIDFGLAQQLEDGITFKSLCGTPQYIGTSLGLLLLVHPQSLLWDYSWAALRGHTKGWGWDPQACREGGGRMVLSL